MTKPGNLHSSTLLADRKRWWMFHSDDNAARKLQSDGLIIETTENTEINIIQPQRSSIRKISRVILLFNATCLGAILHWKSWFDAAHSRFPHPNPGRCWWWCRVGWENWHISWHHVSLRCTSTRLVVWSRQIAFHGVFWPSRRLHLHA